MEDIEDRQMLRRAFYGEPRLAWLYAQIAYEAGHYLDGEYYPSNSLDLAQVLAYEGQGYQLARRYIERKGVGR